MPPVSKRRPPNRRRTSAARPPARGPELEFEQLLDELLAEPEPLAFLAHASMLAELLTNPRDDGIDPIEFLRALQDAENPSVRALLAVLAELAPHLVERPVQAFSPRWVARIADTWATRAIAMTDLGGDLDQLVVEVRLADGSVFTLFTLVDHDLGSAVADAFALPADLDAVLARWNEIDEPGVEVGPIPLADAGARLRESLDATSILYDPPTSDTWPEQRPLLEWGARLLPAGGKGWPHVEWTERDLTRLAKSIVQGARPRLGPDAQDVVETLLHYAATHALGDPLRWSARSTGIVLDWLRGHVIADEQWYGQVGEALRAVIRYAHAERRQPAVSTAQALAVVADWELDRAQERVDDLLERLGDRAPDFALGPEARLRRLADEVGGERALADLSAAPISPEAADLGRLPADVLPKVREAVAILDPVMTGFFDDPELRLAAISFLVRAAEADPAPFLRSSNPAMSAAAAAWVGAKVNDEFGQRRVGDLMTAFGVKGSASQRAGSMLRALDLAWFGPMGNRLGDVGLLTSRRRRAILEARDNARAELGNEDAPSPFPTSIRTPDGRTIEIQHQPGLAAGLLEELKPLLAADGIDLDDPDNPPDREALQAGLDRATERYNMALFTPVGRRRSAAVDLLQQFAAAFAADDDPLGVLDRAQPEARDERVPEVSAVIGVALGLVDEWLSGRGSEVPRDLGAGLLVPKPWRRTARSAAEILALGTRDRAAQSLDALIARQGGEQVLAGAAVALALAAIAWADRTSTPLDALLPRIVR